MAGGPDEETDMHGNLTSRPQYGNVHRSVRSRRTVEERTWIPRLRIPVFGSFYWEKTGTPHCPRFGWGTWRTTRVDPGGAEKGGHVVDK